MVRSIDGALADLSRSLGLCQVEADPPAEATMRWQLGKRSSNIEDRRGAGGGGFGGGFGGFGRGGFGRGGPGMRIPVGRAGGIGGIGLVAFLVIALLLGVDPGAIFDTGYQDGSRPTSVGEPSSVAEGPEADRVRDFVSAVLGETVETWQAIFAARNATYPEPTLVLFTGAVNSACGFAQAATGPFYCPGDRKIYLDTSFLTELEERFSAAGDFAQAYVIAHEVGHHVQNLLGVSQQVRDYQAGVGPGPQANDASVRLELQADCFAGVWAKHEQERQLLETGDVEEAMGAATAIGDDRLQRMAGRRVTPDSFTHGSSEQRVRWFRAGYDSGELEGCNTFNGDR
jgi:predicted metalloprotease